MASNINAKNTYLTIDSRKFLADSYEISGIEKTTLVYSVSGVADSIINGKNLKKTTVFGKILSTESASLSGYFYGILGVSGLSVTIDGINLENAVLTEISVKPKEKSFLTDYCLTFIGG